MATARAPGSVDGYSSPIGERLHFSTNWVGCRRAGCVAIDHRRMPLLLATLTLHSGVASREQLLAAGVTPLDLHRALRTGVIVRVRRAWFALRDADADVVTAVHVGGSLSCISLLRRAGLWVPRDASVHVSVAANASRLRLDSNATIHWAAPVGGTTRSVDPLADALAVMAVCQPREDTLVALDSSLNRRLVDPTALAQAFTASPVHARELLSQVDRRHDSGLETMACARLRALGVRFRVQVQIAGVGRVDILIGDRLVLELDGREFHSRDRDFDNDRRRDLALTAAGYIVLRVSYRQMLEEWAEVERVILSIVRRKGHLRRTSRAQG